ncbi:MAG TPA: CBS domain-containing protein [Gaiellaceae bacterium]|nr:CBS domain-containing protein [Gaiellaceae bacterium]
MPTVGELMHRGLVTCRPDATLAGVATLLVEHRIHAVVVAGEDGEPRGVVSDTDLLAGEWLAGDEESLVEMRSMTAADLMTPDVETIDASAPMAEAAARLGSRHLGRLVVLDGGAAVGVLSVSDVVGALARHPAGPRTVADAMSRGFVACRPDTTVAALARTMTERRSRSVVVLSPDGQALGVVTGQDLISLGEGADERQAVELMHHPLTIGPTASLQEAADRMLHEEVHRLLVVDPEDPSSVPLGVLSTADVLAEMTAPGSPWLEP